LTVIGAFELAANTWEVHAVRSHQGPTFKNKTALPQVPHDIAVMFVRLAGWRLASSIMIISMDINSVRTSKNSCTLWKIHNVTMRSTGTCCKVKACHATILNSSPNFYSN
jgi:hypothetical protein